MKKRNKIILIVIAAILVSLIGGGIWKSKQPISVEYVTEMAKVGNLTQTVSATGSVKSTETIDLNFASTGRIVSLPVKVGDKATKGQVLATLDSSDLSAQLRQYQANLVSARANLDKLIAGATSADVGVTKEQVNSSEVVYNSALVDLANARKAKLENMPVYRDLALSDLDNYAFKAKVSLDVIYDTINDSDAKDTFSLTNAQLKIDADTQRIDGLNLAVQSDAAIALAKNSVTNDPIITAIDKQLITLNQVKKNLETVFSALINTLTSATFTEAELDALKTNIRTEQTATLAGISALQTDKTNLATKEIYYQSQIDSAQSAVDKAKAAWDLAKAQLNLKKAAPRPEDVDYYRSLVTQAEAQVAAVQSRLSDRVIVAPVDGIVTQVNNTVGETSSLASPVLVMLPNDPYYVEVDISEADIAKVKVGDKASFTLDAYGSDNNFTGVVMSVEPAETVISGVIYYKVKISYDKTDKEVKSGMTANIDITTASKDNVLFVPQRAVKSKDGKKVIDVMVVKAKNQIETKEVTVGLKGDNGMIEILSGLSDGDEVVVYTKNGK